MYLTEERELFIYDFASKERRNISNALPFNKKVNAFCVSPNGKDLYLSTRDNKIIFWRNYLRDVKIEEKEIVGEIRHLSFDPSGQNIIVLYSNSDFAYGSDIDQIRVSSSCIH
jgi:hypothetical protein